MKNLKRALSLALASVMVLGLMMVGAGAASFDSFSDKDKVVNQEAVSILNNLNVINGKDDGSFDPTGIVTRAEMAKMICVVLNGGREPQLGSVSSNTYSDTASNWAAAYIEYCTTLGIVGGDGTGKFNPANTVTGAEAAKMLLVAVGYNATYEKMVGAQWAMAVDVLANTNNLYDGLNINPSEGLSRDNAAQMVYNALSADMVGYKNALVTGTDGTLTSIASVEKLAGKDETKTLLTEKFGAVRIEGTVIGNEFVKLGNNSTLDNGKTQIKISNYQAGQDNFTGSLTFNVNSGAEAIARAVYMYVKPSNTAPKAADKATVIGGVILDEGNNKVVIDTSKDTLADVMDDNNLELASNAVQYNQYGDQVSISKDAKSLKGVERTLIDNDNDGEVEVILNTVYTFGKVTKYSTKDDGSITIATAAGNLSKDKSKNVTGFDDVAKDDYVLVAEIGGKLYVEKAESVTGDLTQYKDADSLTVDGTKYSVSGVITAVKSAATANDVDSDLKDPAKYTTLNSEATFYLDKAGNVVAVGDAEGASDNYAILWAASESYGSFSVKVTMSDGTTGVYDLSTKKDSIGKDTDLDTLKGLVGNVYTYSLSSDDVITLKTIDTAKYTVADTGNTDKKFEFTKNKAAIKVDGTTVAYGNDSTVFFNISMTTKGAIDDVDVYTGIASAPSVDTVKNSDASKQAVHSIVVFDKNSSSKTAKAVVTFDAKATANGSFLYIYGIVGNNDYGTQYKAVIDGETVDTALQSDAEDNLANGVYSYTKNSADNYVIGDESITYAEGFVTLKNGNSVVIKMNDGTSIDLSTTSSTNIATIDGDDTDVKTSFTKGDYVVAVYDDDEITGLYVIAEVDGSKAALDEGKFAIKGVTSFKFNGKKIELDLHENDGLVEDDLTIVAKDGGSYALSNLATGSKIQDGTKLTITSNDGNDTVTYTFKDIYEAPEA